MIPALWAAVGVLLLAVVFLGLVLAGALRQLEELRRRAEGWPQDGVERIDEGLPVGAHAPAFQGTRLDGVGFSSADLAGREHLVILAHPGCRSCEELIDDIAARGAPLPAIVVSDAPAEQHGLVWRSLNGRASVVLEREGRVASAFRTEISPHAFVVDRTGRIAAQGVATTVEDLERLVAEPLEGGEA